MLRPVRARRVSGVLSLLIWSGVLLASLAGCRAAVVRPAPPSAPAPASAAAAERPTVILLSFDGWRWDYDSKAPTPNLRRVLARGVRAERLIPAFPSKTFPNHYTIVTGLYPAHHGIVGNTMFDPDLRADFGLADRGAVGDGRWFGGEPVWVTASRHGLLSATLYWPGSEAEISGVRPRFWSLYDEKTAPTNDERVARILSWLDLPVSERPSFITGYFSDTDHAGHDRGPDSPEVRDAIVRLDAALGRLLDGLEARGLLDRVNLVITSDHGMAATSPDRVIYLGDYLDLDTVALVDLNPTVGVNPKTVTADAVYQTLRAAHPHLRVYPKEQTPDAWRFRDHRRIPAIVGVADDGWVVRRERPKADAPAMRAGGAHGYAPDALSMHGLFVAAGPAFVGGGVTVPAFENVHVYNMLAAALGIAPAANDGDPAIARRVLRADRAPTTARRRSAPSGSSASSGSSGSSKSSKSSESSESASGMPNRTLTAVRGVLVGHHTLSERPTGCTAILVEAGAVAGVDVRGSAPGTRETALLRPENTIDRIHGLVLSGGSAFGLDAASGVMRYLDERNIGVKLGALNVPIVPAAVLIDLWVGGKPSVRPAADCGYAAARAASAAPVEEGNVGAGAGATIGKIAGWARAMKGGIGTASITTADGVTIAALVAVNALGDVIDPATGRVVAGVRTVDGASLADARVLVRSGGRVLAPGGVGAGVGVGVGVAANTTLGVIATDAALTKVQATRVAQVAHDGFARAIWPVHTQADGDAIFVIATGQKDAGGAGARAVDVTMMGALAADVMATAIVRGVRAARGLPGIPAIADWTR